MEKNKTMIQESMKAGKDQYKDGKKSNYTKQFNDKIKTIEKTTYPNGVVKERLVHLKKGKKEIF